MKLGTKLILSISPFSQSARNPQKSINYHRHKFLYGRTGRRYTGKELDAETGLYYYGARYLDPRVSRWLSGDPAMWQGDYLPSAPVNDEARRRNGNLPGQGGIFNYVNLHVYHYGGNNPVKYIDPDGRVLNLKSGIVGAITGAATEILIQGTSNLIEGKGFFDDLDISDIAVSIGVGFVAGATGYGMATNARRFTGAVRDLNRLKHRDIGIAVRRQIESEATREMIESAGAAVIGVVGKNLLQETFNMSSEEINTDSIPQDTQNISRNIQGEQL